MLGAVKALTAANAGQISKPTQIRNAAFAAKDFLNGAYSVGRFWSGAQRRSTSAAARKNESAAVRPILMTKSIVTNVDGKGCVRGCQHMKEHVSLPRGGRSCRSNSPHSVR